MHELVLELLEEKTHLFRQFYECVGMGTEEGKIEPGCRVYAKAANGEYYYGMVATIEEKARTKSGQVSS